MDETIRHWDRPWVRDTFETTNKHTRTPTHCCYLSIDYSHVGSIMQSARGVKKRTAQWLWPVRHRERTSLGEWTHKNSITTPLFSSIHRLSQRSPSYPAQRRTPTLTNAGIMLESKYMSVLFLRKELKKERKCDEDENKQSVLASLL